MAWILCRPWDCIHWELIWNSGEAGCFFFSLILGLFDSRQVLCAPDSSCISVWSESETQLFSNSLYSHDDLRNLWMSRCHHDSQKVFALGKKIHLEQNTFPVISYDQLSPSIGLLYGHKCYCSHTEGNVHPSSCNGASHRFYIFGDICMLSSLPGCLIYCQCCKIVCKPESCCADLRTLTPCYGWRKPLPWCSALGSAECQVWDSQHCLL